MTTWKILDDEHMPQWTPFIEELRRAVDGLCVAVSDHDGTLARMQDEIDALKHGGGVESEKYVGTKNVFQAEIAELRALLIEITELLPGVEYWRWSTKQRGTMRYFVQSDCSDIADWLDAVGAVLANNPNARTEEAQ